MKYAIIGSGHIGAPLSDTFAQNNIKVAIANSRGPGNGMLFCKFTRRKGR